MIDYTRRSVLVTGASSGIGNAIAVHLARQGYTVLATVRKTADAVALHHHGLSNLQPVCPVDLTDPAQILAAAGMIKERIARQEWPPLYAVVNAAGGGQVAPLELMNIPGFRDELEKRLTGPLTLLQQLIPLLRETKGRICWISTPGLFPLPFLADIHAPDFAVNYLARTLNLELQPDGIRNILVRCGGINTSSPQRTDETLEKMYKIWPPAITALYRERLQKLQQNLGKFNARRTAPEKVAALTAKILATRKPRVRYQVGYMSSMGALLEMLPQSWTDYIMGSRER